MDDLSRSSRVGQAPGTSSSLDHRLASAVEIAGDRAIEPGDLPIAVNRTAPAPARVPPATDDELRALVALLREHAGNIAASRAR
jgi:hypothetical protein